MEVKLVLNISVNTDEEKSVIEDRLNGCDFDSLVREELEFVLDEFGEIDNIEIEEVTAKLWERKKILLKY